MIDRIKGDASVHTANPSYRSNYDNIFSKSVVKAENRRDSRKEAQPEAVGEYKNGTRND